MNLSVVDSKGTLMHDILNIPAKVGDRVLTKGYYSANMNTLSTITKVNKTTVTLDVKASYYDYYNSKWVTETAKPMKRDSSSFIIINEQLAHNYATYTELFI